MSQAAFEDIYPLTSTQKGMLFHSLYAPESGVYCVQVAFTLEGQLDTAAFETAWQTLATRHTVLRTAFAWDKLDAPLQVVGRQVKIPCEQTDLRHLDHAAQSRAIDEWHAQDRLKGFNLARAPLMRVQAFQCVDDRHRVICSYHHLLLDGWSLPLLLGEWRLAYLAAAQQQTPTLPVAPGFGECVRWLQQQSRDAALRFWREELQGFHEPTLLGKQIDNTSTDTGNITRLLSAELSKTLSSFARQNGLTQSSLIQGAWSLLLSHYCASQDVVFGLTRSGRPTSLPAAQQCVGLFITTLPMRAQFQREQSTLAWLQSLQSRHLAQQSFEYIGQSDLRQATKLGGQQPLFDTIVVFENYPAPASQTNAHLHLCDVNVSEQTHYPLSLFAVAGEQLELRILYDRTQFSQQKIIRILAQLEQVLTCFCQQPHQLVDQIDLRTADEKVLLQRINRTTAPAPDWTVDQAIEIQAQRHPDAIAIVDANGTTTYADLQKRSDAIAHQLRLHGLGTGHRIGLCMTRNADMVAALLGIMRAGAAYVPLDAEYPTARLQHMLEDSQTAAVICDDTSEKALAFWNGLRIELGNCFGNAASTGSTSTSGAPAYVIYTSGSSGLPKGVEITHHNLANLLQSMAERTGFSATDRWLAVTTLSFDIAALELFLPLLQGGQLVIASNEDSRNPEKLAAQLQRQAITFMQATPSTWRLLLQNGWMGKPDLKVLSGGEALDPESGRQLLARCCQLWNVYGPTETTIWSTALQLNEALLLSDTTPIGAPLANTTLHVLDQFQRPVPMGACGELCIGGSGVANGYINRGALTADKFIHHSGERLYRTGDRVQLLEDGLLTYLGRFDHQTKLRGYRIELEEIETHLRQSPLLEQAAVVVQGDSPETFRLVAFCVISDQTDHTTLSQILRTHLAACVPGYMIPAAFYTLSHFPQTPNGKLDRNALRQWQPPLTQSSQQTAAPTSSLESSLLQLWRTLLNNPAVTPHDHFFEVGGHSLLIVTAQSKLRQTLGVDIPLVELFQHPTVTSLARHIESQQAHSPNRAGQTTTVTTAANRTEQRQRLAQRRGQPVNTPNNSTQHQALNES